MRRGPFTTIAVFLALPSLARAVEGPTASSGTVARPRGTYLRLPVTRRPPAYLDGAPPRRTLFINGDGGTYYSGYDNSSENTSSIPWGTSTLSGWGYGADSWAELMDCMREQFGPYNIEVTDGDPAPATHIEAAVSGSPGELGLSSGIGGIAPFDCGVIENAIVFAFAGIYGDYPRDICETAAQEIGHAMGMDHEYYCPDNMTYLYGCGEKTFTDYDAPCGEYSERYCDCGGYTQNSHRHLLEVLGPGDTEPPTVSIDSPEDGATVDTQFTVHVTAADDNGIASVALYIDGTFIDEDTSAPFSLDSPANLAERDYDIQVKATDGSGQVATDEITVTVHQGGSGGGGEGDTDCVLAGTCGDGGEGNGKGGGGPGATSEDGGTIVGGCGVGGRTPAEPAQAWLCALFAALALRRSR